MTGFSIRSFRFGVWAAIFLLAVATPGAFAYQDGGGWFDSGGGRQASGSYQSLSIWGVLATGTASSNKYAQQEGQLAFYGRPFFIADAGILDFGGVETGDSVALSVAIVNYGGVGLYLSGFHLASAGGPTAFRIVDPADRLIAPGADSWVEIVFLPESGAEEVDTLLVGTNDPSLPMWALPLYGFGVEESVPILSVSPGQVDFGAVPVDSAVERSVLVRNLGGPDLEVDTVIVTSGPFSAAPLAFTLESGDDRTVGILFSPSTTGAFQETLYISNNDPSLDGPAAVILTGRTPSEMEINAPDDNSLMFTAVVNTSPPPPQEIRIANSGADTLRWKGVVSGAPWLAIEPDSGRIGPGDSASVAVSVDHLGMPPGGNNASILLQNMNRPIADVHTVSAALIIDPFIVDIKRDVDIALLGESVTVTAGSDVSIDSALIYIRHAGEAEFTRYPMIQVTTSPRDSLELVIPGPLVTLRGLEYYVEVFSGENRVARPDPEMLTPARLPVHVDDFVGLTIAEKRHTMISVPLVTGAAEPAQMLMDDLGDHAPDRWRFARWGEEISGYREYPDPLEAPLGEGFGFWLITAEETVLDFNGRTVFPLDGDTTVAVPLKGGTSGWNQIGHPFAYTVRFDDCLVRGPFDNVFTIEAAAESGMVENALYDYVYDGDGAHPGWVESELLEPWRGYFIHNVSDGDLELLVPAVEAVLSKTAGKDRTFAREGEWEMRISSCFGTRHTTGVTVGARIGARTGWDSHDRALPPSPFDVSPDLVLRGDRLDGEALRADIRPPSSRVTRWEVSLDLPEEKDVCLMARCTTSPPEGMSVCLVDETSGAVHPLSDGAEYRFAPMPGEKSREFRVVAGPAELLGSEGYRAAENAPLFHLGVPSPNPTREGAVIRYSIPESGRVRASIYNIGGRLVRSLRDGRQERGDHILTWDGRDGGGRESAPGIYFLRLNYEDRALTTRIVLFR